MLHDPFIARDGLIGAGRLPSLTRARQHISIAEIAILLTCGAAAAAATGLAKLGLGIPGHAIVLTALPMALGLALAPRRLAGSMMSAGALGTAWVLGAIGPASYGSGSFVSLCLLGPMLDVAVRNVRSGRRVYLALVAAGIATNVLAYGSRAAAKVLAIDAGRPFDSWWLLAALTYTVSGAVAGLLGAVCWFHFNDRRR